MNILIVDDHQIIVDDMKDELSAIVPDAEFTCMTNPLDVLPLIGEKIFDIAFLDIDMPGINGISLAKKILEQHPTTNVIYVTGYEKYALESYDTFASAFLIKPITTKKLRNAMDNLRHPISEISEEMIRLQYSGKAVIGHNIEKYREQRHLSRQDLATQMAVSLPTVYRWENGDRIPDVVTFMKLSHILGVSMDKLLTQAPNPK